MSVKWLEAAAYKRGGFSNSLRAAVARSSALQKSLFREVSYNRVKFFLASLSSLKEVKSAGLFLSVSLARYTLHALFFSEGSPFSEASFFGPMSHVDARWQANKTQNWAAIVPCIALHKGYPQGAPPFVRDEMTKYEQAHAPIRCSPEIIQILLKSN